MEPTPQNSPGVAQSSPPAPMVGQSVLATAAQKSTEEQRKKWREKAARQKERKLALASGQSLPEKPATESEPDPVKTHVASVAVVPWNPNTLLPLATEIFSGLERADIEGQREKAAKIAKIVPSIVADVEKHAPWNPVAKTSLATSGSAIAAKWLARLGIKEENAPEVVFLTSSAAILAGRNVLIEKMDKILAKMEKGEFSEDKKADAPA